ncbi:hypothetical protein A3A93_00210 [Candidatus Roizmanbacteria bacterium RIFCSPLOWO2_01_FULL_38_12]|uniref:Orotate phosphoribosyltransferase n=1 Tax=Candidatus Roizmanbacteria bacterium RIFCSPLOWO2_01_FULL_38_12 TaxID=1802061 RepID=A0A1F7IUC8_9BACT|nr:MAG: hypothetical protein A2861_00950 [Candidatus Roizmanbacteria bacterium RIFCSPHIGHO2_01_FULL_38_15]OGK34690.1 MAG: hypothetical protein A3F59_01030 [Candidatus Roizmanbacteria bacterium RIFCSPHIGHO2_12_FULL_38_13]OGK46965.1 MAG: hypothetical protein A3A93_00210 [Candidatus Roizmanbacteria bacterium RIFCSPLOWO2_01_FULL_38_12]
MLNIDQKKELISQLIGSEIIKVVEQSNTGDLAAPYQINLKVLTSYPDILKSVGNYFGSALKGYHFDMLAGPFTDIPLATTISLAFNWPMIFVREIRKEHGMERLVEGNFKSGQKVVVVDDEIDDISSTLQLLGRLEGSGLEIVGIFVLLDRGYGALEAVKTKGYHTNSLLTLNDIFVELVNMGQIKQEDMTKIKEYTEGKRNEFLVKSNLNKEN